MKKTHNKYKKHKKHKKHLLKLGHYGLKVRSYIRISKTQKNYLLNVTAKKMKEVLNNRKVKIWSNLCLNQNLTKLSAESRMGKGKGAIFESSTFIQPGIILLEFDQIRKEHFLNIYKYLKKKISVNITYVEKYIY